MAAKSECSLVLGIVMCMVFYGGVDCAITWTTPAGGDVTKSDINEGTTGVIYTFAATATAAITYSLDSQSVANTFSFAVATGVLTLATGKKLDFETAPTHVVKVKAVEAATPAVTSTGTLTINLVNVNEAPVYSIASQTIVKDAVQNAGDVITTVQFTDPDAGQTVTHAFISGNGAGDLVIGATSGIITVASGKTLEASDQYTLIIKGTDNDSTPKSATTQLIICIIACANTAGSLLVLSALTLFCVLLALVI